MRGRKGQSYEGGFRAPFIARWPGQIPAGRADDTPLINLDIFPTLLHLAGVGAPDDRIIDGKNIAGILTGRDMRRPHEALYFYHYDLLEGVRAGRWKYFEKTNRYVWPIALDTAPIADALGKKQMGNRWPLLYDLESDPGESYNVINTRPDVAERLRAMLLAWDNEAKANPRGFLKR